MPYFIAAAVRLAAPLLIFKKPFWGMLLAVAADGIELEIIKILGFGADNSFAVDYVLYQRQDKVLDIYMASLALYVARSWKELLVYRAILGLFIWRFVGVVFFEITGQRTALFYFPNLFEFFFLYYSYQIYRHPEFQIGTKQRLFGILIILLVPKLLQEYVLHIEGAEPWAHIKHDILGWPRFSSN